MKIKRFLCVMLAMIMIMPYFFAENKASAYVAHTPAEAVAWAKSKQGQYLDYYKDEWYAQCVELVCFYYEYLGVSSPGGNAKDYATRKQPDGWTHIPYYSGFVPQPGDIAVWTYLSNSFGHVAIVVSANQTSMTVVEQNGRARCVATETYSYNSGTFFGVIRPGPNFTNCTHSYSSASPYVCTKCNEWKTNSLKSTKNLSNVQYTIIKDNAIDHTGPYGECKTVNKYSKNTIVTVTQEVVNAHGSTWYKLSNGNYIWGDYVKKYTINYVSVGTGSYNIKNVATGTYLSVSEGVDKNEQPVNLWTSAGTATKMVISKSSTGYKIRPGVCQSRLINPNAVTVSHGNDINIYNDVNDSSQWWQFEKVGDYYVIHNVQNPSCVLDAPYGATSRAYARNYTGASSQKWILESLDCSHTYPSNSLYVCSKCNAWKTNSLKSTKNLSNVQYIITKDGAIDHTGPYSECKIVNKYSKNAIVTVTQEVVNAHGSTWYKLSNGKYIWNDYVKKYSATYTSITEGTYYLKNIADGQYMVVSKSLDKSYQSVLLSNKTGEAGMKMKIFKGPTGYKIMPSMSSTRLINPNADVVTSGTAINIVNDVNDSSQWWQFEKVGDYYVIHNVQNPNCVLDAPNGPNSAIYAKNYTGAVGQKWILEPVNATITYKFDVNSIIDSVNYNTLTDSKRTATCDVYINGKLVGNDVNDFCEYYTAGTKYEIKDIKKSGFECYTGVKSGSLSGTVNGATTIVLGFNTSHSWNSGTVTKEPTATATGIKLFKCTSCGTTKEETINKLQTYKFDVNSIIDSVNYNTLTDSKRTATCDVYINGKLVGNDVNDFCEYYTAGTKYEIKDIKKSGFECYTGVKSGSLSGTVNGTTTIVLGFNTSHSWNSGTVTKEPTISQTGIKTYTCSVCGQTKNETIPVISAKLGDLNYDGKVNALDARKALRIAAQLETADGLLFTIGDVNEDGRINALDARKILRVAAQLETM